MAHDELARQWRAYEVYAREEFGTWADHCSQYPEDWRLLWRTLAEQRDRLQTRHLWRKPYMVQVDPDSSSNIRGISPEVPEHNSVAADLASEGIYPFHVRRPVLPTNDLLVGSHRTTYTPSANPIHNTKFSKRQRKSAEQKKRGSHKPAGVSATSKVTKSTKAKRGRLQSTALQSTISVQENGVSRPRTRLQAKRISERSS